MLIKHGTGQITTKDDTGQEPVTRTAATFTDDEWETLLTEGEPETTEE